jgi:hypothetical protein
MYTGFTHTTLWETMAYGIQKYINKDPITCHIIYCAFEANTEDYSKTAAHSGKH